MLQKNLIFSSLFCVVIGVPLVPCKSGLPMPLQFDVAECTDFPCPMYKNETAQCNITFVVPEDTDSIKATIQAKIGPLSVNYPLPDNEACHFLTNGFCPLDAEERIIYNLKVFVSKGYPKIKFEMETTLKNPNTGKDFLCFKLIGKVTERTTKELIHRF